MEIGLKKVQVKTTGFKEYNNYIVQIRRVRSNKNINKIYNFDKHSVDLLFILCENNDKYLIESQNIDTKTVIVLSSKFDIYKL